ncbi:MAG: glycosyltransferase family 39 protein, partial [Planctomycetota bacterium]|nr:glycosyltransferase family 39 protein [Planctomycetota bacterium]
MSGRTQAMILVALAFVSYATGISGPFLLDDNVFILTDKGIRDLWPFDGYRNRPVLMFTLSLNYALTGADPVTFRLTNIAIHACAALLLYGVVRRTLTLPRCGPMAPELARGIAFAVAAIWVVHPLNVTAVTYIWQRCESQMGLLFLGAIYSTLRAHESPQRRRWPLLTIACCLLGFGTKETMVTVIPVLLLYDWVLISGSLRGALLARLPLYSIFVAVILVGVFVVLPNSSTSRGDFKTWEYASSQPGVVLDYLRLAVTPYPLCFDWGLQPAEGGLDVALPSLALGALLAFTIRQLLKRSWQGVAGAAFFLVLAPTSSFIVINDLMCEYRMYLPLIAVIAFGVAGGRRLCARLEISTKPLLAVVIAILSGLSIARNWDFRSELSVWESTLDVQPDNWRAHLCLVQPNLEAGDKEGAMHHAQRAFDLRPDFESGWKLAQMLFETGDMQGALERCEACLKLRKRDPKAHQQMGRLCLKMNLRERAIKAFRKSVRLAPKNP